MKEIEINFFEKRLVIDGIHSYMVVIEPKTIRYNFLLYCNSDFLGENKYISLFDNENNLDNDTNIFFINDLFHLDLNTKKNINALYKVLKFQYFDELKNGIDEIKKEIREVVLKISTDFDIELVVTENIDQVDLFKIMDLRFDDNNDDLLKHLIKFIFIINELQKISIFIIYRLRDFFTHDDILILHKEISYKNITIIDIEDDKNLSIVAGEDKYVLDNDLCDLY